jgi:hypothetical protein
MTTHLQSGLRFFLFIEGPRSRFYGGNAGLKAYCTTLWGKWWRWRDLFCFFILMEWNWQGKTEVLEEKLVPVPLCPTQIPHGLTPGSKPGLRGERPATNRMSHGTARDEVKNEWNYTSTPPYTFMACTGKAFTLILFPFSFLDISNYDIQDIRF